MGTFLKSSEGDVIIKFQQASWDLLDKPASAVHNLRCIWGEGQPLAW
jgi:hypothetical protein